MVILRSGSVGGRVLAVLGLLAMGLAGCDARVEKEVPGSVRSALTNGPDLSVSAFTPPATVASQELVSFSWTIANIGSDTATATYQACCAEGYYYRWADAVYLSTDAAYSPDDLLVGKLWRSNNFTLVAGGSYSATASLQIPVVEEGSYYLVLVTDSEANRVVEGDEANNTLAAAVTVGKANLAISAASTSSVAGAQELINVSWTVANTGSGGASGKYVACCASGYYYKWEDAAYLSTDATLSPDDIKFGSLLRANQFKLDAGSSYSATASFQLPAVAEGAYYVLLVTDSADNRVDESDETDNAYALPITIGKADLSISSVTAPAQAGAQELVSVSWTVANTGSGGASGKYVACCASGYYYKWEDAAYLSTDAVLSADDIKFGSLMRANEFNLSAGSSYSATSSFQLPAVPEGSYYLLMVTDSGGDRVFESSEDNNVFATPITVGKADLSVTDATAPSVAGPQELVNVSWTVANTGSGGASGKYVACCASGYYYKWEDAAYLSTDEALSADDVKVGAVLRPNEFTLAPGASYSVSVSFQIPETTTEGSYYLLFVTDSAADRVFEQDESNNVHAVPIVIGWSDLMVSAIGAPATVFPRAPVALSWTVMNVGNAGATGRYVSSGTASGRRWEDALYVSTDPTFSADDILLGTVLRADGFSLASGAKYTATKSLTFPELADGTYYLLAVADSTGDRVPELDEGNNMLSMPVTVSAASTTTTGANPGCDQFPLRTMNDNCSQNCCAEHDLCLVQNDCSGEGAGSAACQACDEEVLLCGGDCVNGVKDCATTPCGCGQSLCYSMSCAEGQPGYCSKDCNTPLNDVCLMRQRPGQSMVGSALPQTALANVITAGYRFTPKRSGRAVALGGSFDGTRTVRLYRYSNGEVLASVAHTSTYAFGYTPITSVPLEEGVTYVVAVELAGGDGARMATTLPVPSDYLHLTIDCPGTSLAAGTGMPSSCESRYIGMADVEIDFTP